MLRPGDLRRERGGEPVTGAGRPPRGPGAPARWWHRLATLDPSPGGERVPPSVERQFGEDFSAVRIHTGDGVAERAGARALAQGRDVHFARGSYDPSSTAGRYLLGHELAHVVQQRGRPDAGSAPAQRLRSARLDAEADRVGARVAAGESVAGQVAGRVGGAQPVAQHFGSDEHRQLGEEATRGEHMEVRQVQLADDYWITYGEMVALAGDYFESIDEMRALAANPGRGAGTREEVEYARQVEVRGRTEMRTDGSFSQEAMDAVDRRYIRLAADNRSHFLNPVVGDASRPVGERAGDIEVQLRYPPVGTGFLASFLHLFARGEEFHAPLGAGAGYRMNHVRALGEAYMAGFNGESIERALAVEAFSGHYLTDAFSAGHVRTPRASITEHWNRRVPMFFYNLQGVIAERMAERLETEMAWGILSEDLVFAFAFDTISEKMGAKGVVTFGDLVSGALHDYDNRYGVRALVAGEEVTLYGDSHLGEGDERDSALSAVRLSYEEVVRAWEFGRARESVLTVIAQLFQGGMFGAEFLLPVPVAEADLPESERQIRWDYDRVEELLDDPRFQVAVALFLEDKAGEFAEAGSDLEGAQRTAFDEQVVAPLRERPVEMVRQVVHWTPQTGGGFAGHNADDRALEYLEQARRTSVPGADEDTTAVSTLTVDQKVAMIENLLDGPTFEDEEDAVWELLRARESDARAIIDRVGWERLEDEIGDRFSRRYPRATYAR